MRYFGSLPANAEGATVRVGDASVPVEAEPGLTSPHPEGRAVHVPGAIHRPGKVERVLALHHDLRVVGIGEDAFHGRADLDIANELVTAMIWTAIAILPAIVVSEPERLGRERELQVEGLDRALGVAQLDPQEATRAEQPRARIGEGEEWEVGIVREEARGDLRDPGEVGIEVLGLNARVATEAAIPEAHSLDPPLVHTAHLQATDELLDLGADAFLAGAQTRRLDLVQFGHVANIEQSHLNLRKPAP